MQEFLDKASIREAIGNYFVGLDRRDAAALRSAFTADARWEMPEIGMLVSGREAIAEGQVKGVSVFSATSHIAGSQSITVDGDSAAADTLALTHCILGPIEHGRIQIRGVRYLDRLVRTPDGWRIQNRQHSLIWQYEVTAVPAALPQ